MPDCTERLLFTARSGPFAPAHSHFSVAPARPPSPDAALPGLDLDSLLMGNIECDNESVEPMVGDGDDNVDGVAGVSDDDIGDGGVDEVHLIDEKVAEPSTVPLPPEIKKHMFVPPKDFDSNWFLKSIKPGGDGIGYGYVAGKQQSACRAK